MKERKVTLDHEQGFDLAKSRVVLPAHLHTYNTYSFFTRRTAHAHARSIFFAVPAGGQRQSLIRGAAGLAGMVGFTVGTVAAGTFADQGEHGAHAPAHMYATSCVTALARSRLMYTRRPNNVALAGSDKYAD